jgi:hypothetical protein
MTTLLMLAAAAILLAVNGKWALLDPHAPEAAVSWRATVATALWVTLLFTTALALQDTGRQHLAALVGSFAFGTAVSPSIAPPYRVPRVLEPRLWRRFLRSRLHGVRVVSIKMLLIVPVSLALDPLVARRPSFFASALVALFFSGVKAAYLIELLRGPALGPAERAARRVLTTPRVVRAAVVGSAALLGWLALIHPVMTGFPEPELGDYAVLTAFVLGLLLRPN